MTLNWFIRRLDGEARGFTLSESELETEQHLLIDFSAMRI
jgi:hypothetical protein